MRGARFNQTTRQPSSKAQGSPTQQLTFGVRYPGRRVMQNVGKRSLNEEKGIYSDCDETTVMMKTMKEAKLGEREKVKNFEEKSCRKLLLQCPLPRPLAKSEFFTRTICFLSRGFVRSTFFNDYAIFAPKQSPHAEKTNNLY